MAINNIILKLQGLYLASKWEGKKSPMKFLQKEMSDIWSDVWFYKYYHRRSGGLFCFYHLFSPRLPRNPNQYVVAVVYNTIDVLVTTSARTVMTKAIILHVTLDHRRVNFWDSSNPRKLTHLSPRASVLKEEAFKKRELTHFPWAYMNTLFDLTHPTERARRPRGNSWAGTDI